MQLSTLLPTAALAWSAQAFLLPPDTQGEAMEALQSLPSIDNTWTAHVDCAGCPVAQGVNAEGHGLHYYVKSAELDSDLVMDFAVNENNEVTVGGVPIFPPRKDSPAITVKQVLKEGGDGMVSATTDDIRVSTRVDFEKVAEEDASGVSATRFRMEILGLEDRVVHADSVTFDILRDPLGHVYISNPKTVASENTPLDAACSTVICRVKAQLMAKMAATKAKIGAFAQGCMRKMGFKPHSEHKHGHNAGHKRPDIKDKLKGGPNKFAGKLGKKPCPGKTGQHGHRHHGMAAKVLHFVSRFTQQVLMPIMIGVAAGMAVSALGMVVGHIVVMIWMRLRRRNNSMVAVYHIIQDSDVEVAAEEEPLPKYEEKEGLPAYAEEKTEV